jgi:hypothetical protein
VTAGLVQGGGRYYRTYLFPRRLII